MTQILFIYVITFAPHLDVLLFRGSMKRNNNANAAMEASLQTFDSLEVLAGSIQSETCTSTVMSNSSVQEYPPPCSKLNREDVVVMTKDGQLYRIVGAEEITVVERYVRLVS